MAVVDSGEVWAIGDQGEVKRTLPTCVSAPLFVCLPRVALHFQNNVLTVTRSKAEVKSGHKQAGSKPNLASVAPNLPVVKWRIRGRSGGSYCIRSTLPLAPLSWPSLSTQGKTADYFQANQSELRSE